MAPIFMKKVTYTLYQCNYARIFIVTQDCVTFPQIILYVKIPKINFLRSLNQHGLLNWIGSYLKGLLLCWPWYLQRSSNVGTPKTNFLLTLDI